MKAEVGIMQSYGMRYPIYAKIEQEALKANETIERSLTKMLKQLLTEKMPFVGEVIEDEDIVGCLNFMRSHKALFPKSYAKWQQIFPELDN